MALKTSDEAETVRNPADPSTLTTQQLWREIAALKELAFNRMAAIEKAVDVAHADLVRVPTDVQQQVAHLRELHDEKFESIRIQFAERDTRTEQTSRDNKVAVDAALQAAKEAVGENNKSFAISAAKQEASTIKQIDQQALLIATVSKTLDDKIGDLKERLTRIEGSGVGVEKYQAAGQTHSSYTLAIIGFCAGTLIGLIGIAIALARLGAK